MWRNKKKEELQLNLTPLIDVVFLLLIFFMISTSFKKETKITLDLPEANGEMAEKLPESIEISINKDGEVFVNGEGLINRQLATIKDAIKQVASDPATPLVINADAQAPYQAVVSVMDAAGQVGFNNLTLATQQPKSDIQD
ncbi:ExbD/TolR family protein [Kangiella koreensis]|uniref:Biopolymer transport protein ExbD/TolR n=1 Tax=Kangiella koreensis (strain DSM 16069 / JCM 12317 / KCTC 12182 / SW-125) TaxID=523791 RepID=C7RBZ7_KANKD|nr:biopolymer transporter ExbD [Kangiella koreensis]ACV26789.1 Biopolymer transport protein ExbD/TolR [Kangiella koreensis DSM 16069]